MYVHAYFNLHHPVLDYSLCAYHSLKPPLLLGPRILLETHPWLFHPYPWRPGILASLFRHTENLGLLHLKMHLPEPFPMKTKEIMEGEVVTKWR